MTWSKLEGGWLLERCADKIEWAHDDSAVAMWGRRERDVEGELDLVDARRIWWGPVGAPLAELAMVDVVEDVAWLPRSRLALRLHGRSSAIAVVSLPTGMVRARREIPGLVYSRLESISSGQLFLHDAMFPSDYGHTLSTLDPEDLTTTATVVAIPRGMVARSWISPDGRHSVTEAARLVRVDGGRSLSLPHAGSIWVTWLSPSRFVVVDTKHPARHTALFDVTSEQPLLEIDHHADVAVEIDLHADDRRALVREGQALRVVALDSGESRPLVVPTAFAPFLDARCLPARETLALLAHTRGNEVKLGAWDVESGRVTTVSRFALRGQITVTPSNAVLERTPGSRYLVVRWCVLEGQHLAVFPSS
jgi:hypothetical protein